MLFLNIILQFFQFLRCTFDIFYELNIWYKLAFVILKKIRLLDLDLYCLTCPRALEIVETALAYNIRSHKCFKSWRSNFESK
jgi:hypothetical protein